MKLTPQQFDQLQQALLDGFNRDELTNMVRVGLGETLGQIAYGTTDTALLQSLIEWSERTNNVQALIEAAVEANPRNAQLLQLKQDATGWFEPVAVTKPATSEATRLPSVWNVPLRRNPNFTGRDVQLEGIHSAFSSNTPGSCVHVVSGLGGVGKTQLATEYAYRYSADYDVVWWVRSEEPVSLTTDYAGLAAALELPEAQAADQREAMQAVLRWLSGNRRWLVVLDNATDYATVRDYLPAGESGHVLITSRYATWGRLGASENLPVLSTEEAVAFLLRRTGQQDEAAAAKLAEELGYLPLALEQAGAYMEETGRSLPGYLALYANRQRDLLKRGKPDGDYPDTVLTTWQISFEEAGKVAGAAELLNLCAYLAPNAIPLGLISAGGEMLPDTLSDVAADELSLDDAVAALRRYSLVQIEDGKLDVHRMVQAVVRDRLDAAGQEMWAEAAVRLVNNAFPEGSDDVRTWPVCAPLLPHALVVARRSSLLNVEPSATGQLLSNVGDHLWGRARYLEAKAVLEQAIAIDEAAFGAHHPNVARDLKNLGGVLRELGNLEGAKRAYERALKIDETAYGPDDHSVGLDVNNLGVVLLDLGDLVRARQAIERALKIDEAAFGSDHPNMAIDVNNLGLVLRGLGDLEGARQVYGRALKIGQAVFGPDHPDVATIINNLGMVLRELGDLEGARQAIERALKVDEAAYGPDHPRVATDVNNLGMVLRDMGDMEGARQAIERTLKIDEVAYGPDHPEVARDVNRLGLLLRDMGDQEGAKKAFERALLIFHKLLGEDNPNTQIVRGNLESLES